MEIEHINCLEPSTFSLCSRRRNIVYYQAKEDIDKIPDTADDSQSSSSFQNFIQKAQGLMAAKKWQQAIQCCDSGLEEMVSAKLFYIKGRALGKLGKLHEMAYFAAKAIELDPSCPTYLRSLASAEFKLRNLEESLKNHLKCLELQVDNSINYHNIGAVLYHLSRFSQAIPYFQKAIRLNACQVQSHRWLGHAYREAGQFQKALDCYYTTHELSQKEIDLDEIEKLEKQLYPWWKTFFGRAVFC